MLLVAWTGKYLCLLASPACLLLLLAGPEVLARRLGMGINLLTAALVTMMLVLPWLSMVLFALQRGLMSALPPQTGRVAKVQGWGADKRVRIDLWVEVRDELGLVHLLHTTSWLVPRAYKRIARVGASIVVRSSKRMFFAYMDWHASARRLGIPIAKPVYGHKRAAVQPRLLVCPECNAPLQRWASQGSTLTCRYCGALVTM